MSQDQITVITVVVFTILIAAIWFLTPTSPVAAQKKNGMKPVSAPQDKYAALLDEHVALRTAHLQLYDAQNATLLEMIKLWEGYNATLREMIELQKEIYALLQKLQDSESIDSLELSDRVRNILVRGGKKTIGDVRELLSLPEAVALASVRGFGKKSLDEIRSKLLGKPVPPDSRVNNIRQ